jgi:hypothetical protein
MIILFLVLLLNVDQLNPLNVDQLNPRIEYSQLRIDSLPVNTENAYYHRVYLKYLGFPDTLTLIPASFPLPKETKGAAWVHKYSNRAFVFPIAPNIHMIDSTIIDE